MSSKLVFLTAVEADFSFPFCRNNNHTTTTSQVRTTLGASSTIAFLVSSFILISSKYFPFCPQSSFFLPSPLSEADFSFLRVTQDIIIITTTSV